MRINNYTTMFYNAKPIILEPAKALRNNMLKEELKSPLGDLGVKQIEVWRATTRNIVEALRYE